MPRLAIYLFGSIAATVDDQPVDGDCYDKVRALLAYLAVESHRAHSRPFLADFLWSKFPEQKARQNLSQALYRLRHAVGDSSVKPPVLSITSRAIRLNPESDCWVDVEAFSTLLAGCARHRSPQPDGCSCCFENLHQGIGLYRDDFLAGFSVEDSPEFDNWALLCRERYRRMAVEALAKLAHCHEQRHEYSESAAYARRWLELEPWDESAHRHLMRTLASSGKRASALQQYERCCEILENELGVEPSVRTTALYVKLRGGKTTHARPHARGADPVFMAPPLPPQGVVGRDAMLSQIVSMLSLDQGEIDDDGLVFAGRSSTIVLQGMGGIGKTTLALALARLDIVSTAFPDGVLWASLGPAPTVRNILDSWGRALDIQLTAERDEQACSERLRSVLHRRRALLVIDDVWDIDHSGYFAVAGPHCRTVYTTRESPIAHALATPINTLRIDVLTAEASLQLLQQLAPQTVQRGEQNARLLCERLGYLPLAVTLAGRMLANESDVPSRLQHLVCGLIEQRGARLQLLQTEGRLGLSPGGPASLEAILGMSIDRLSPVHRKRFAMLAVFASEPLVWDIDAAAHVWDCPTEQAEATVSSFVKRGLVAERDGRYWVHSLLADYAYERLKALRE